jgi:membrane-associated phospholipid phosphatase
LSDASVEDPLVWKSHWGRYHWIDFGVSVAGGLAAGAGQLITVEEPRWQGGILFDKAASDVFTAETESGRETADMLSDIPFYASAALIGTLDPLVAWARGYPDTALQLLGMGVEVLAITGGITLLTISAVARGRPGPGACFDAPELPECEPRSPRSFPSGHTAIAFAGASYFLAVHNELPLFGARWADLGFAITMMGLATSTAFLRMGADAHHASDVIVGSLIGMGVGFGIPYLRYFHSDEPADDSATESGNSLVVPWADSRSAGVTAITRW